MPKDIQLARRILLGKSDCSKHCTPLAERRTHTEVEHTLIHKTGRLQTHTMETSDGTPGRLVVADGVTEIACRAYMRRKDLREVWLPDSVVKIGEGAFTGCMGIVDLHLPATLQSIGDYAFSGCTGLVDLHLPDTLQSIGDCAFFGCMDIVDLHFPATLQSIGHSAFHGCSSLARVLAPGSLVRGEMADPTNAFAGCPVLATGLTPLSSVRLLRRTLWHPTMHSWCTPGQRMCVLAVLVAELR